MNVALMGSVSSSWFALDALLRGGVEVTGVLGVDASQAARISDYRDLRDRAEQAGVPYHAFVKVSEPGVLQFLQEHPADLLWVIGISQLVGAPLLACARHGAVGFHPTKLPEGRGRAPVAWTILRGADAAVNLFYLCDEADAGDLIVQRPVPVLPDDYSEDLIHRTNLVLADTILELAPRIIAGDLPRSPQDHSRATYYPKRTPADGLIDWRSSTAEIYRLIRAAGRPYPGAFTYHKGEKVTIWRGRPVDETQRPASARPGSVLAVEADRFLVGTSDGALCVTEFEIAGAKPRIDRFSVGDILEAPVDDQKAK